MREKSSKATFNIKYQSLPRTPKRINPIPLPTIGRIMGRRKIVVSPDRKAGRREVKR